MSWHGKHELYPRPGLRVSFLQSSKHHWRAWSVLHLCRAFKIGQPLQNTFWTLSLKFWSTCLCLIWVWFQEDLCPASPSVWELSESGSDVENFVFPTTREGWTQSRGWEQWVPSLALPYIVHTPYWLPIRWKTSQQARDSWVSTQEPSTRIKLSPASLYSLGFEWRHYFASFCQLCLLACSTGYVTCGAQRKMKIWGGPVQKQLIVAKWNSKAELKPSAL